MRVSEGAVCHCKPFTTGVVQAALSLSLCYLSVPPSAIIFVFHCLLESIPKAQRQYRGLQILYPFCWISLLYSLQCLRISTRSERKEGDNSS